MNSSAHTDKVMQQLTKIRRKRVSKIKNKINSGQYHIDNLAIAKALFLAKESEQG